MCPDDLAEIWRASAIIAMASARSQLRGSVIHQKKHGIWEATMTTGQDYGALLALSCAVDIG